MNQIDKVSVCIPAYNGSQHLGACLDSALRQTYSNIEVVAVEDQSTDSTLKILQEYAARDRRMRILRNETNLGLVGNWNRCIQLARGEWIKFLFQDDLLEPSCIEKMLELGNRVDSPLVVCRRDFIFEDVSLSTRDSYRQYTTDISLDTAMKGRIQLTPEEFCDAALKFGLKNFVGEPTSTLIRNDVFQRHGQFNSSMIQLCDLEFWLRVGVNHGIAYVPETLAHFRIHPSSTTSNNSSRKPFLTEIIDPTLLRRGFAISPDFSKLRCRAAENGINLKRKYFEILTSEIVAAKMRITARSNQIDEEQRAQLEILESVYASTPVPLRIRAMFGPKLVKAKLKRLIDRHVTWRFRKT